MLRLLRAHGWNATSFQVLEPGYHYFFDSEREAVTAYVDTGGAWVAAGSPIASDEHLEQAATSFLAAARSAGRRASFAAVGPRMTTCRGLSSMRIGEQPSWDPRRWDERLRSHRSLREQLRRARAKGVTAREVPPQELVEGSPLRRDIERMVEVWLASRAMAPLGFLARVHFGDFREECRTFVAERRRPDGRPALVGLLSAVPVYGRGGWFLEDLLRDPAAPNGTAELLVDALLRRAAADDCRYVTLGLSPLSGDVGLLLRAAARAGAALYDFDGLRRFKAKLRPAEWTPIHLSYPRGQGRWRTLFDMLQAFSDGGMLRFGLRTLLRGPAVAVRALAAALVPWTIALAIAPPLWFPNRGTQLAWITFDTIMVAALATLSYAPSAGLAAGLAAAAAIDALLTWTQLALWNAPRLASPGDVVIAVAACSAPPLAAMVLWGARGRLKVLEGSRRRSRPARDGPG